MSGTTRIWVEEGSGSRFADGLGKRFAFPVVVYGNEGGTWALVRDRASEVAEVERVVREVSGGR